MGLLSKAEKEIDLYFEAGNEMHPAVWRSLLKALEGFIAGGRLSGSCAEYLLEIFDKVKDYSDEDLEGEIRAALDGIDIIEQYTAVMKSVNTHQLTLEQKREVLRLFVRLGRHRPLTPLLGTDEEWNDVSEMSGYPLWQNLRDSRVFRNEWGYHYYVDARAFEDKDGFWFNNYHSIGYFGGFPFTVPEKQYFRYGEWHGSRIPKTANAC